MLNKVDYSCSSLVLMMLDKVILKTVLEYFIEIFKINVLIMEKQHRFWKHFGIIQNNGLVYMRFGDFENMT